jgi:Uma2 family endonuclease
MQSPAITHPKPLPSTDENGDRRIVLFGVPWHAYVALRDTLDEPGIHMSYLEGTLEIMTPGGPHETGKKLFARLLEAWAEESDVELDGHGSQTFRREAGQRGLEPDECYGIGLLRDVPDIAIEVVVSRPLVDKLAIYAGLGIQEVWLLEDDVLSIHVLKKEKYEQRASSELLPALDFEHLLGFLRRGRPQTSIVRAYRAELRSAKTR